MRGRGEERRHLHHQSSSDDVVQRSVVKGLLGLVVEVLLVRADGLQQLQHVVGVQRAGLCGHAAGQVGVANVRHALSVTTTGH